MVGTNSKVPQKGTEIKGKLGIYKIKKRLGRGGNGIVFEVDVKNSDINLTSCTGYAIKILNLREIKTQEERQKRYKRFQEEINAVRDVQNEIEGIIPVLDTSFDMEEKTKFDWYLMPKASEYDFKMRTLEQKFQDMKQLALTINKLHKNNKVYAHRDIKPQNLLWYNGRVCLSDFGLVWNPWRDSFTMPKDNIGPIAIRPPELDEIDDAKKVDYTKSDVYLFVKTMWIILTGKRQGFTGEYRRDEKDKYLDKRIFHVRTMEPMHRMLEEATKHFYGERINIDDCIFYIQEQLNVISKDILPNKLNELEFVENARYSFETLAGDGKTYTKTQEILPLLEHMENVSEMVFDEYEVQYNVGELYKIEFLDKDQYLLKVKKVQQLQNTNYVIAIREVRMNIDLKITIITDSIVNPVRKGKIYNRLREAVNASETDICISGNYCIRLKIKGS